MRWPRARTVSEIPSVVDVVSFTVHPGCPARALLAAAAAAGRPRISRRHVHAPPCFRRRSSSRFPRRRRAAACPTASSRCRRLGTCSLRNGRRACMRRRPVAGACRRRRGAVDLHPFLLRDHRCRFNSIAEPTVTASLPGLCHICATMSLSGVAKAKFRTLLELAWHCRCGCLSAMHLFFPRVV